MSEQLLAKLAPRLKQLDQGAYERAYRTKRGFRGTGTHQLVAKLLGSLDIPYKENVQVPGAREIRADFLVNGVLVFV